MRRWTARKKKDTLTGELLRQVEEEKKRLCLPYRTLCVTGIMSYSKLMRCRNRLRNNEKLVCKRGPAKFGDVDMKKFREEVMSLNHGRKRTAGVGELHSKWGKSLSRRVINEAVRLYRDEVNRDKRAMQRRRVIFGVMTVPV